MPYVLKHKQTGEIYSCTLINIYDIPYHGAKSWEDAETAEEQYAGFLHERNEDANAWRLSEVEDSRMKMFNVKLNNDPNRRLFMDQDGRITVRPTV